MPLDTTRAAGPSNEEILGWMRKYQTQKRACSEENGVLRSIVKQAKGEGVDIAAMIKACERMKLDPEEMVQRMQNEIRYVALRSPSVTREALFDTWSPRITEKAASEQQIADAEEAGYRAGLSGVPRQDGPYTLGSELDQAWAQWHGRGVAAKQREAGENAEVASTSRTRPKRASETEPQPMKTGRSGRKASAGNGRKKAAAKPAAKRKGRGAQAAEDPAASLH